MSEGNIEILGQKLSYPTTWQGAIAVFFFCTALVIVAFLFKGWATPDTINAVKGLYADASVQDNVNQKLLSKIEILTERISTLEGKDNGISTAQRTAQKQEFSSLKSLFDAKTTTRFQAAPDAFKAELLSAEQLKRLVRPEAIQKPKK